MRLFEVGDKVEFEIDIRGNSPRWSYSFDCQGNGQWVEGQVIALGSNNTFSVLSTIDGREHQWGWPQPVGDEQRLYSNPGYLRLATCKATEKAIEICRCDITQLWNYGHNPGCPERKLPCSR